MNKKVLHVVSISFSLPYFVGDQFIHFKNKGVIYYVASSPSDHFFEYAEAKGFIPWAIGIERKINPLADIKAIIQLITLIKENDIDVVIGHTPKGGFISMIAAYMSGVKKRIYFRHGIMYETSVGLKRRLLKTIEQISGKLATKVICVSESIRDFSNDENLSAANKNLILGKGTCNGINDNFYNRTKISEEEKNRLRSSLNIHDSDKVIGFVGRLVNDKGISELLIAWQILLSQHTDIKLLLVGPFDDRDAICDDLRNYILSEPSIVFTDMVRDARPYYTLMNMFILPSYREGFPTVVLEASSMKLPIITTRTTGCRDSIIENQTGIFTTHHPDDIAGKISYYIKNEEIALDHGRKGREFVSKEYNQGLVWREIEHKVLGLDNS